ncbi:RILP-like protein 1 [Argiope bruennichi]|uniref:RILP-like protein 1 like protein n=1 Tax=Argiope bruennichi TaxID=94029 RepID=A0A8T0FAS2_ARGBR|nr:RILP-like protein 1 [Argiope bruennichi]KAF8787345.1 RILP-like protein 1 like protein [Argiope bruennichi]
MSDLEKNFTLQEKDVYDFAYDIAQEFEKIINTLDTEQIVPLINKVIKVLELLEQSVKKIEYLEKENSDLKCKYIHLKNEKTSNEGETRNLKLAFEELEESYSQECTVLRTFIDKLKTENKLLQNTLAEKNDISSEIGDTYKVVIDDQEKLIAKLKTSLRQRETQLEKNYLNAEALNAKIDHLIELNKSLHIQYQQAKNQAAISNFEKNEYEAKLYHKKQEVLSLEDKLHRLKMSLLEKSESLKESECKSDGEKFYLNEESLNFLLQEQHELKQKVAKLQMELASVKNQNEEYRKRLNNISHNQNPKIDSGRGRIQQIFHLFLGVININSGMCWFRGI